MDVLTCAPGPGVLVEPPNTCPSNKATRHVGDQRLATGSVCRNCFAGKICIMHDVLAAFQTLAVRMVT